MGKYIIELPETDSEFDFASIQPYTEPDLEQARMEAYEQGRKDGKIEGQAEVWECVKKIAFNPELVECVDGFVRMGFDVGTADGWSEAIELLLEKYSASECIEKIRQYEQEQKQLHVGDEVNAPFGKAIVVNIDSVAEKIWLVYADGHGGFEYFKDAPLKTGRRFPEIAEVLAKMKEADNG